ncbi:MAG: hypothetical protein WBC18_18730 [Ottowia sp.]|uniref:Dph6-related ATP pyrophosphatase n=1 Tax=Ottowia sp. TaxID=1898956 RepID=UPI003C71FC14
MNVVLSWSSGKDSALSLLRLREDKRYRVIGLCTTHVEGWVPYQNVSLDVAQQQADRLGLPLIGIALPQVFPPNEVYQRCVVDGLRASGLPVGAVGFGDMFHNGIADYRRSYIEPAGWQCVFPLLGEAPAALAREVLARGIRTRITTVDTDQCRGDFCGAWYDDALLASLPSTVDPCGENGEFHTLVLEMPGFSHPLDIQALDVDRSGRFHSLRWRMISHHS